MEWIYDDGGREEAGYKGKTGDCVCRAISIATGRPYAEVYRMINETAKTEKVPKKHRGSGKSSARTGVYKDCIHKVMEALGWEWIPLMKIGTGCTVHLRAEELPNGKIVCSLSRHLTAVIDGVIHDTYDCSRGGTRCVYGYYRRAET